MHRPFATNSGEDNLPPEEEREDAVEGERGFTELNTWLHMELGRRLTIVLILPPGGADEAFIALGAALAAYPEVLVLVQTPRSSQAEEAERIIVSVARVDPDAVLVAIATGSPTSQLTDSASIPALRWPRDVLAVADRIGLRMRTFLALLGETMTREGAHRLGYVASFSPHMSARNLVVILAREALARERARRHGSSPPCYL